MAHRGARARAPENCMESFLLALEHRADAVETDLRITKDRVIVCIHDDTVDRTTNSSGSVDQFTWDEISKLRVVGNNDHLYPQAAVPSLGAALDALTPRTYLALELKSPLFTTPADVTLLLETLQKHNALNRVLAISFNKQALNLLEQMGAPFPLAYITLFNPWPVARFPMMGPWWPLLYANPFYVDMSHGHGQICCPLDPTPEARLPFYLKRKVDALLSDDPLTTQQALDQLLGG